MAGSSTVCDVCQGFGEDGHPRGWLKDMGQKRCKYLYLHYPDVILLKESASRNCHACLVILSCLDQNIGDLFRCTLQTAVTEARSDYTSRSIQDFELEEDNSESGRLLKLAALADDDEYLGTSPTNPQTFGKGRVVLEMVCGYGTLPRNITGLSKLNIRIMTSMGVLQRALTYLASPGR